VLVLVHVLVLVLVIVMVLVIVIVMVFVIVVQLSDLQIVCVAESYLIRQIPSTNSPLPFRYYHAAVVRSHQSIRLVVRCGLMASEDLQDLSLCSGPLL
jgi:hypothetical protein